MQNLEEITPSVIEKLRELLEKAPFGALNSSELEFLKARASYLTEEELALVFPEEEQTEEEVEEEVEAKEYSKLTVPALKALCAERGIEIPKEAKTKAPIIALIEAADAAVEVEA